MNFIFIPFHKSYSLLRKLHWKRHIGSSLLTVQYSIVFRFECVALTALLSKQTMHTYNATFFDSNIKEISSILLLQDVCKKCTCFSKLFSRTPAASPSPNQLIRLLITLLIAYRQHEGQLGNRAWGVVLRSQPEKRRGFLPTETTTLRPQRVETEMKDGSASSTADITSCSDKSIFRIRAVPKFREDFDRRKEERHVMEVLHRCVSKQRYIWISSFQSQERMG